MEKHRAKTNLAPGIWLPAIALLVAVGGYFLVIRPIDQKREAMQRETAEKQGALASQGRSITLVCDDSAKVDAIRRALSDFELKLPPAGEMDKVLEDVWRLAEANSLQTRTIKTPPVQRFGGFREQQMDLSLSGDFGGFYQFLLQLEESKRVLRITKIHLTKPNEGEGRIQAEMTIGVFFEPEKSSGDQS
jgi:Tfp pilus assembly protein PilO